MASFTEISKQLDSIQDMNPTLKTFLISMGKRLESQQDEITELRSEVQFLKNKLNDVERYQSKDCIIFRNLPLLSNRNVTEDVVHFVKTALGVQMDCYALAACHPLGRIDDPRQPPAIIAKFLYFDLKNSIWGRKKLLSGYRNQLNGRPVFLDERLTRADKDLMDYARDKGAKTQTFNSQPQVLVQTVNGFRAHTITSKVDVDELLEENKILVTRTNVEKPASSFNTRMEMKTPSGKRPFQISSPINDGDIIKQLESFRGDNDKMLDYVKGLLDKSPANKLWHQDGD